MLTLSKKNLSILTNINLKNPWNRIGNPSHNRKKITFKLKLGLSLSESTFSNNKIRVIINDIVQDINKEVMLLK